MSISRIYHTPQFEERPSAIAHAKSGDAFTEETHKAAARVREDKHSGKATLPADAVTSQLMPVNLAEATFATPRSSKEIAAVAKQLMDEGTLVGSIYISAQDLDRLHTGSVDWARHLNPTQPGLSTGSNEDRKKIRVIWRYKPPKSGERHPEKFALTDGSLAAAWLTSDEDPTLLKEFELYTARCCDRLSGNEHALDKSTLKRILYGIKYRFGSYARGIKEGLVTPRFNGSIGANLLLTSLPISALLYGIFYGLDYLITKHEMVDQDQAVAAAKHAAPLPLTTSATGSYSLNG